MRQQALWLGLWFAIIVAGIILAIVSGGGILIVAGIEIAIGVVAAVLGISIVGVLGAIMLLWQCYRGCR